MTKLNKYQEQAVNHKYGTVKIVAGAGAGKTSVLTERIKKLISQGVPESSILAITFTRKAADELKERIGNERVTACTFHSFCARILRENVHLTPLKQGYTIIDSKGQMELEKTVIKHYDEYDKEKYHKKYKTGDVIRPINAMKDIGILPGDSYPYLQDYYRQTEHDGRKVNFSASVLMELYGQYQSALVQDNAMDFGDLLMYTKIILENMPDLLEDYQDQYRYILVDEYQDTNPIQYELIRLLSEKYGNLCIVGDPDQSIYAFRGADINNILNFEEDFEDVETIKLEDNYRSQKPIIEKSNQLIRNNVKRIDKTLRPTKVDGGLVKAVMLPTDKQEADYVAKYMKEAHKRGYAYKDMAVLYRANYMSRHLENAFVENNVPYDLVKSVKFYERKEILDLMSYVRLMVNQHDMASFLRVSNVPKRRLSNKASQKLATIAIEKDESVYTLLHSDQDAYLIEQGMKKTQLEGFRKFYKLVANMSKTGNVIRNLVDELKYFEYIETEASMKENADERKGYVTELENAYSEFIFEHSGEVENVNELICLFLDYATLDDSEEIAEEGKEKDEVSLMTIHGSKGLEFPIVALYSCADGTFPHAKADIEEERRLMYVGCTRAKEELLITTRKTQVVFGRKQYPPHSRFIDEMGINLEIIR